MHDVTEVSIRTESLLLAAAFAHEIARVPIPGIVAIGIVRREDGNWPVTFVLDGPAAERVKRFIIEAATSRRGVTSPRATSN